MRYAPAPPLLRNDRLTLELLGRMAREFDQLSARDGRDWPAARFVEWLASGDESGSRPAHGRAGW